MIIIFKPKITKIWLVFQFCFDYYNKKQRINNNQKSKYMGILVYTVTVLVALISLYVFIEGIIKNVPSCYAIGGITMLISVFTAVCHLFGWLIPVIIIFGILGVSIVLMGASGEQVEDTFKMGIRFCVIGLVFCFISFYYWYISGWYTSMAIVTCTLSYICIQNAIKGINDYVPRFSVGLLLLFVSITIYVCVAHRINIIFVLLVGIFIGIISRYIWKIVYYKFFWIKLREPWKQDSFF